MADSICLRCENKRFCGTGINQPNECVTVSGCSRFEQRAKVTNADTLRAMTDEELAETMLDCFAAFYDVEWSKQDILDWLKQEAKDDSHS